MVVNRQCMLVVHYGVIKKHPINIIDYKWIQDLVVIIVNQCLNYVSYLIISVLSFFLSFNLLLIYTYSLRSFYRPGLTTVLNSLNHSLRFQSFRFTVPHLRMRIHITMINKIKSLQSTCTRIRRRI